MGPRKLAWSVYSNFKTESCKIHSFCTHVLFLHEENKSIIRRKNLDTQRKEERATISQLMYKHPNYTVVVISEVQILRVWPEA